MTAVAMLSVLIIIKRIFLTAASPLIIVALRLRRYLEDERRPRLPTRGKRKAPLPGAQMAPFNDRDR